MTDEPVMQIGEVAARTELSLRSLRHWEDVGLLRPSGRSDGGFRLYTPADVVPDAPLVSVPVPARFSAMLQDAPDLALAWRLQTRAQFQHLFARGYQAVSFRRDGDRGAYLLVRG